MDSSRTKSGKVLRILCALVLLSLGLAHQAPSVGLAAIDIDHLETYRLPDGSFASLCLNSSEDHKAAPSGLCEACLLSASIILPPPDDKGWLLVDRAFLINALSYPDAALGSSNIITARSRGPPSIS
ncbi:hypothetical protein [Rhizobium oryzicola]|uniref:Uncharacterized protein n=1 Tax=Rhizobium oryzicola TaxID=1232668 RepID=A0ABT8SZF3_9HYPH|nr:hypothetical protein [Rhizobium oryzicola]MDO1583767.1 hypothetical protein [Rhizobium oryzicola]